MNEIDNVDSIKQAGTTEVVFVEYVVGDGSPNNPCINCYSLYNKDGEFLAEVRGGWIEDV